MRLTTRKTDAFTEPEERFLRAIAHHGIVWFPPNTLEGKDREALNDLDRLGHVIRKFDERPKELEGKGGTMGYRITDRGRLAVAELERRERAAA